MMKSLKIINLQQCWLHFVWKLVWFIWILALNWKSDYGTCSKICSTLYCWKSLLWYEKKSYSHTVLTVANLLYLHVYTYPLTRTFLQVFQCRICSGFIEVPFNKDFVNLWKFKPMWQWKSLTKLDQQILMAINKRICFTLLYHLMQSMIRVSINQTIVFG